MAQGGSDNWNCNNIATAILNDLSRCRRSSAREWRMWGCLYAATFALTRWAGDFSVLESLFLGFWGPTAPAMVKELKQWWYKEGFYAARGTEEEYDHVL